MGWRVEMKNVLWGEGTMDVFWNSTHYKGERAEMCLSKFTLYVCNSQQFKDNYQHSKKKHEFQLSLATNNSKNLLALAGLCLLF